MRRRRPDEQVISLRLGRSEKLDQLACRVARWANDATETLGAADPEMPSGIFNRAADNWRPLLAVADLAGGAWPARARNAALALSAADGEDTDSAKVLLIGDLRTLFCEEPSGVLFTRDILSKLTGEEAKPWAEWKNDKPLTARQLAALLREFRIQPQTVRRGKLTEKGYKVEWFEDAFTRYLPPRPVTASQPSASAVNELISAVTPTPPLTTPVTAADREITRQSADCDCVTDGEQVLWRERV
jgi:putative DNA primase/helicase